MKEFRCGDIVPGCTAKFRGATEEEILAQVAEHARTGHGIHDVPAELAEQVRSLIKPIAGETVH
ncbi:MAG: DUF1059 domain-containing protein [Bryobacterales bacterium]|nr:DUF1059 domain-containing protein [Bryobacterales bacterium]